MSKTNILEGHKLTDLLARLISLTEQGQLIWFHGDWVFRAQVDGLIYTLKYHRPLAAFPDREPVRWVKHPKGSGKYAVKSFVVTHEAGQTDLLTLLVQGIPLSNHAYPFTHGNATSLGNINTPEVNQALDGLLTAALLRHQDLEKLALGLLA